jgi:hypothetical protein
MDISKTTKVTPQIYFLGNILERISIGELRVPNFQRPFVWKPDDMIALFESIESGYPVGSLLFWKTDKKYHSLPNIGPYEIPENHSLPSNYILDGHQRLSTLYGILTHPSNKKFISDQNKWRWTLYYDLKEKRFLHARKAEEKKPHFIPLFSLLQTIEFLRESRRIEKECQDEAGIFIEQAERLAQTIREYQIATTQIEGGDLDSAVNIFTRLNSKGIVISEDRMYSALTYKEGASNFNLSDRIDAIQVDLANYNFSGIKRMAIFRSILAAAGRNIYTKGKLNIFTDDKNLNLEKIVDSCAASLLKAVMFLRNELHVPDDKFLPYNLQLILLSEFFRLNDNPSDQKKSILKKWFWITSFVGLDTTNTSKVTGALEEIRQFATTDDDKFKFITVDFQEYAQPFPSSFNLTSARVRAYVLFLLNLQPKSFDGRPFDAEESLSKHGYKALHYIISKGSKLSNRILLGPVKFGLTKKMLKQDGLIGMNIGLDELKSHGITEDALQSLKQGYDDKFLDLREKELIRLEREFMQKNGVIPNSNTNTQESVSDTDINSEIEDSDI